MIHIKIKLRKNKNMDTYIKVDKFTIFFGEYRYNASINK